MEKITNRRDNNFEFFDIHQLTKRIPLIAFEPSELGPISSVAGMSRFPIVDLSQDVRYFR
jgi:hypothetical protein